MGINLRNYRSEDYAQVKANLEVAGLFWEDMDSEALLSRMMTRDPESIIVAENNGQIVGSAYFIDMGFAAMLSRLNVVPEHRKTGLGRRLIDEVNNRAKKRGFTQVHLTVHEEQERLKEWYKRQGCWEGNLYRWMGFDLRYIY